MKSANKNAAGPALLAGDCQAKSATQAAWRFLNNSSITLADLVEPLREVGPPWGDVDWELWFSA